MKKSSCRDYALRLITFRSRTEGELRERLHSRGYTLEEIEEVVLYLKENNLLDDNKFAEEFILEKMRTPLSPSAIKRKLRLLKMGDDIIQEAIKQYYNREEVKRVIKTKIVSLRMKWKGKDPRILNKKILEYFMRRGFSYDDIRVFLDIE